MFFQNLIRSDDVKKGPSKTATKKEKGSIKSWLQMQMRQKLLIIRRCLHSRKKQTQRRQIIWGLNHKTWNNKTKAWSTKRQKENCCQQWNPNPFNLLGDNFTYLWTVEITQGQIHTSYCALRKLINESLKLCKIVRQIEWKEISKDEPTFIIKKVTNQ